MYFHEVTVVQPLYVHANIWLLQSKNMTKSRATVSQALKIARGMEQNELNVFALLMEQSGVLYRMFKSIKSLDTPSQIAKLTTVESLIKDTPNKGHISLQWTN